MSHRILVPVEILEGEDVPEALLAALSPLPVTILGYHVLPEQTPPGQAKLQFEERAQNLLAGIESIAEAAGCSAETRLVFTHEEAQTFRRVAAETGSDAILVPNPAPRVEDVLVSLRGEDDPERVADVVAAFAADDEFGITLLYADQESDDESSLDRARQTLVDGGVAPGRITGRRLEVDAPVRAIGDVAGTFDLVVVGEQAPSLREFVFGDDERRIADRSLGPVLVVRRPTDAEEAEPATD